MSRLSGGVAIHRKGLGQNLSMPIAVILIYLTLIAAYAASGYEHFIMLSSGIAFVVAAATLINTRDIFHPFCMIPLVHGMYSTLPLASNAAEGSVLSDFGLEGGAIVFSSATLGIVLSWSVYLAYSGGMGRPSNIRSIRSFEIPRALPWILLALGVTLSAVFFATVGFGEFASSGYLERFQIRLSPGMGIFVNGGVALTTIALAMFVSQAKISIPGTIASAITFLIFFIAYGERKYIIIPALLCIAAYHYRVRKLPILATFVLGATLYLVFEYVGYVRVQTEGGVYDTAVSIPLFLEYFVAHLGQNELAPIYGTASAAYAGFVQALPNLGDYLLAWSMAVPQFLMTTDYVSAEYRFAMEYAPLRAIDEKMGWGFSFFGEAYMVMGIMGPALAAAAFCAMAAAVQRHASQQRFQGIAGTLWFTLIYFQIWTQRAPFSTLFKDWLIYQVIPISLVLFGANLMRPRARS